MKLRRLDLLAFGPFTEEELDFGSGDGLHLVYGPNEAGKSSTLRALKNLLFGIPHNSADNFVHAYPKMRIGAVVVDREGEEHRVVRRKGTKDTLLDDSTQSPLDAQAWQRILGRIDEGLFESLFAIDHQELVDGSQAILHGGGNVGQILFAAGAGIGGLRFVCEALQGEAEKLFKPGGRNPLINEALAKLVQARKDLRDSQTPTSLWQSHQKALQEARSRLAEIESQLDAASREKGRLERILEALPLVAERQPLAEELAGLGGVRVLRPSFDEEHRQNAQALAAGQANLEMAQQALAEIEAERKGLYLPEVLLEEADVDRLHDARGSHRKAQNDTPGLAFARDHLLAEAAASLGALRPGLSLDQAEQLRLSKSQIAEIQRLGNRHEALLVEIEKAQAEEAELGVNLRTLEVRLAQLPPSRSAGALQEAVQRCLALGDLESQLVTQQAELAQAEEQAAIQLARLPRWSGRLEELERLAYPASESIDWYEDDLNARRQAVGRLRDDIQAVQAEQRECERRIQQLQLEGDVPSENALNDARQTRDAGWRLVVGAWRDEEVDRQQLGQFLASAGGASPNDLAEAYEQSVESADDVADRLRREAARVTALAQLSADRQACEQQLEKLEMQLDHAQAEERDALKAWRDEWAISGIDPGAPKEMRAWRHSLEALCQQAENIRVRRAACQGLADKAARAKAELEAALRSVAEPPVGEETLTGLLARSRTVVKSVEALEAERHQLQAEITDLKTKLALGRRQVSQAQQKLAAWQEQWSSCVQPLGLPPQATPAEAAETLAQTQDLLAKLKETADKKERLDGMARDAQRFAAEVQRTCVLVAPDLATAPLEAAVDQLLPRLRKGIVDRKKLAAIEDRAARQRELAEQAERQMRLATAALAALCAEAGVASPVDLTQAERVSAQVLALRSEIENIDGRLRLLSAGSPVDVFIAETEPIEADGLPGAIARRSEEVQALEARRKALLEEIGAIKREVSQIDGNARAADRLQELQGLLATVEADAGRYVRLRLASIMLREGIQRYRERNEGPVLRRASQIFSDLTLGSFEGLRTDYNERDEPVLVGLRAGSREPVPVELCMSEGTADQLYLALRLAGLQAYLAGGDPLPLIVDDILVNFDDARAVAALKALAEFSEQTQVIFFTHHQHLVRLAEENIPSGLLSTHSLRSRSLAATAG